MFFRGVLKVVILTVESIADLQSIRSPFQGQTVYVKSYWSGLGKGGGHFVYDSTQSGVNDGGMTINGWVRQTASLNPSMFGTFNDGILHPLSEKYNSLDTARQAYKTAVNLEDSIDTVALESFFNYCKNNFVINACMTCNAYVTRPIVLEGVFETRVYNGFLILTNTQTEVEIEALLKINSLGLHFDGVILLNGHPDVDVKTRKQLSGLIIGDGGTDGSAGRVYIDTVYAVGFRDFGIALINDSIFPTLRYVHTYRIGTVGDESTSYWAHTWNHEATISNRFDDTRIDYQQYTELTVDSLPPNILGKYGFKCPIHVKHDGELYRIISIDQLTNKIRVYPCLNGKSTNTRISYIYGVGLGYIGNNSGCGHFDVVQTIVTGIGFWGNSLYGANIGHAISEYCGIGLTVGSPGDVVIGYNVCNSYFETNQFNFVSQWDNDTHYNQIAFQNQHEIDLSKCANLFNFRISIWDVEKGGRREHRPFQSLGLFLEGEYYSTNKYLSFRRDLTSSADILLLYGRSDKLLIDVDKSIRLGIYERILLLPPFTESRTITPPDGWSFDKSATFPASNKPIIILASIDPFNKVIRLVSDIFIPRKGPTASRPALTPGDAGFCYFDTTLSTKGKPIWWTGIEWVDSTGS